MRKFLTTSSYCSLVCLFLVFLIFFFSRTSAIAGLRFRSRRDVRVHSESIRSPSAPRTRARPRTARREPRRAPPPAASRASPRRTPRGSRPPARHKKRKMSARERRVRYSGVCVRAPQCVAEEGEGAR